ncbi:UNVERIFIED_CONTAM: hypothetical protein Slati_3759000 [Sesamum latifolium]|uniref:Separase-like second TPR repeats region domain-containing protein n=1 Tax=Sesamum latifolium TaxID=2727402 RepID=A0AAW2U572_9LAMI
MCAAVSLCDPVAEHLYRVANALHEDFPHVSSILRLYATGLLASSSSNRLKGEDEEKYRNAPLGSALQVFLNKEWLQQVCCALRNENACPYFSVSNILTCILVGLPRHSDAPRWGCHRYFPKYNQPLMPQSREQQPAAEDATDLELSDEPEALD